MMDSRKYIKRMLVLCCLGSIFFVASKGFSFVGETYDYQTEIFKDIEATRGLPVRGMSSTTVLSTYGEPSSKTEPVGNPPISVWFYDNFNVYLEYQHVITAVAVKDRLPTELRDIQ